MDQSTPVITAARIGAPAQDGRCAFNQDRWTWATTAVVLIAAITLGLMLDDYQVSNLSYFLVWTFMAFGLCLMWGYAGILSFGQTAFFGLAGYGYAVFTTNFGAGAGSTLAGVGVALALAGVFAAILGYFMFYGGVTGVFVSIITLATTLVFETFLAQTAGPEWTIGRARLNGFNGMTGMPALSLPWVGQSITLDGRSLYLTLVILVAATYFGLRMLVASRFGQAIVAIRENANRAEMLGYNVRLYQLTAFVIGSVLAGFSGVFYVSWGQYITPESMSLYAAALPVVWVTVGGRRSLTATLIGTVGVLYVSQSLAIYGDQFALVLLGVVLLAAVMLSPQGFIVGALAWAAALRRRASRTERPASER
jgi:branched-chain amino acid transport system permease protein